MALPPIVTHVSRVLPPMLLKVGISYAGLWFLQSTSLLPLQMPAWVSVFLSILAIPILSRLQSAFQERKYKRDAAANAAAPVPSLPLTPWQAVTALRKSYTTSPTPSKSSVLLTVTYINVII